MAILSGLSGLGLESITHVDTKTNHIIVHLRCRVAIVLALCVGILCAFLVFPAYLSVAGSCWYFQSGGLFIALLPTAQLAGDPGDRHSSGGQRRSRSVGCARFLLSPGALVEPGLVKRFFQSTPGPTGVVSALPVFGFNDRVLGSRIPVCLLCKVLLIRLLPF